MPSKDPLWPQSNKWVPYALIVLVGVLAAIAYAPIRNQFVFDDAYITFRYSMNIADGYGLVWNPGQPPEEGYTSFLHVMLLVVPSLIMRDPLVVAQMLNSLCATTTAILIFAYGRRYSDSLFLSAAIVLLFLIAPITWSNAYSGLETSIFGLLIALTLYTYVCTDRIRLAFALAFLTGLARPEGFALGVLMAGNESLRQRSFPIASIWYFLPLITYAVAKTAYYGYLLPNPFVFKATIPGEPFKLHGVAYVKMFVLSFLPLVLMVSAGVREVAKNRQVVLPAFAAVILIFYLIPTPLMGFHDRFLYSVSVTLFMLGSASLLTKRAWIRGGVAVLVLAQGVLLFASPRMLQTLTDDHSDPHRAFEVVGKVIGELPERRSIHAAVTEAGHLPFHSQMEVTDLLGLNTRAFASEREPSRNIDRLFELEPDLLFLTAVKESADSFTVMRLHHGVSMKEHHLIPLDPRFSNYEPLLAMRVTGDIYTTISLAQSSGQYSRLKEHLLKRLSDVEGVERVGRLKAGK